MDFRFSEEERAAQDLAKAIMKDLSTPERLARVEETEDWVDRELWAALAKAELLGCALSEDVGGADFGFMALCLVIEQAGRRVARAPLIETLVMGALPIDHLGSSEQRQRLLPPVVRGESLLTAALLEPGADLMSPPGTTAVADGEGHRLSGLKIAVPLGPAATRILVPAGAAAGEVGLFLVDPTADGVCLTRQIATDGEPVFDLQLDRVLVGAADRLGTLADGAGGLVWLRQRVLSALAAQALGLAQEALIMTARYATERQQFGRAIATFQAVSQRAGDAYIDVEAMRLTSWQAAWRLSQGLEATREVTIARWWAAEGGHRVTCAAQHLHGGMGFDKDYPLYRYFLRAKRGELALGPGAAHLAALGRGLAASV